MTVAISTDEYKELQMLRNHYGMEEIRKSVVKMRGLEKDIDLPIKTIVGMFALLGCEPLFSCCGFDYAGQPIHKTHEYGNAYVMLRNNKQTKWVIEQMIGIKFLKEGIEKTSRWRTWEVEKEEIVFVALSFDWEESNRDYPWTKTNCIHYSEKGVIGLGVLRKVLWKFRNGFLDNVILSDTNNLHNKNLPYWQYPGLEEWKINKEELVFEIEKER